MWRQLSVYLNYYFSLFRCHALAYVNFSYCEHVTDAGVELLATISSLISLDLSGCNISDPGVVALGNNPNFRDINISECCNVTDNGIQKFVPQVKDLETLDLSHLNVRMFRRDFDVRIYPAAFERVRHTPHMSNIA